MSVALVKMQLNDTEERILKALDRRSATIEELSHAIGLNRITVSKYLAIMEAGNKVKYVEIGKAKLFSKR